MIKTLFLTLALQGLLSAGAVASDTLYFRFSNCFIKDSAPYDTLIFDLDIRSSTSGTYLTGFQTDIFFNTDVFGINAVPVSYIPLEMAGPSMIVEAGPTNPYANSFRYALSALAIPGIIPYDPDLLSLVPTASWGKLIRYKMLVLDNTQNLGMHFDLASMTNNQKFVQNLTYYPSSYDPVLAFNDLLNHPSTPTSMNVFLSELGDPSDSGADFIELCNAGSSPVDLSQDSWFLTVYNGIDYQNIELSGNLEAGGTFVAAGSSFAAAYPGKSPDQVSAIIEQNGAVSWYLTLSSPYNNGILIDQYHGQSYPFTGQHAVRHFVIDSPDSGFIPGQWTVTAAANMDMTPGSHRITLTWDGSSGQNWADTANWTPSFVPDAGHNAMVPVSVSPQPALTSGSIGNCHDILNGSPDER